MNLFRKIVNRLRLDAGFYREGIAHAALLCRYSASAATEKDIRKLQYTILRINHTLEKGLSMPEPRLGFGRRRALHLIGKLDRYAALYGSREPEFLAYPLQTLAGYMSYTEHSGVEIPEIRSAYGSILQKYTALAGHPLEGREAGIETIAAESIRKAASGDFRSLLESRHAIRSFSSESVPEQTIKEALELARRTPSACNRQGWKTHVFRGDRAVELIRWQEGCKGFEDQIRTAILVTADLRAFLDFEPFQAYVDGGLYAMNLINALHYLGLGTIPVSCGLGHARLKVLHKQFDIPRNEVPIVIVGAGILPEEVKVATSLRKDISLTNTFHE